MDEEKIENEELNAEASIETPKEAKKYSGPVLYCGPDVQKYGMKKYTLYSGGLMPGNAAQAIKEVPEIEKFLVRPSEVESVRAKVQKKGTIEYEYYQRIANA